MKKLSEIFDSTNGDGVDLCSVNSGPGTVDYVSRSETEQGVIARVASLYKRRPGVLTVALGGSVLATFLRSNAFITAQNVRILSPKEPMSDPEKLWYAAAIRQNRYKFNFGRHANKGLSDLRLPEPPAFVKEANVPDYSWVICPKQAQTEDRAHWSFSDFKIEALGTLIKGTRFREEDMTPGKIPYIGASDSNNGITGYCAQSPNHPLHPAGSITISYDGSIGNAFLQSNPFHASDAVNILYPHEMPDAAKLYICACIKLERFRYNYGRKWGIEKMRKTLIKLPVIDGYPDYAAMARYILGCRFSAILR